jgi:hypothetical protein
LPNGRLAAGRAADGASPPVNVFIICSGGKRKLCASTLRKAHVSAAQVLAGICALAARATTESSRDRQSTSA